MDRDGGSCFPGVALVAEEAGVSERTVQRAVRTLEQGGFLARQIGGGRHRTNQYIATIPAENPDSVTGFSASETPSRTTRNPVTDDEKPRQRRQKTPSRVSPKDVHEDVHQDVHEDADEKEATADVVPRAPDGAAEDPARDGGGSRGGEPAMPAEGSRRGEGREAAPADEEPSELAERLAPLGHLHPSQRAAAAAAWAEHPVGVIRCVRDALRGKPASPAAVFAAAIRDGGYRNLGLAPGVWALRMVWDDGDETIDEFKSRAAALRQVAEDLQLGGIADLELVEPTGTRIDRDTLQCLVDKVEAA